MISRKEQNLIFKKDINLILNMWVIKKSVPVEKIIKYISNCYTIHKDLIDRENGECRRVCCIAKNIFANSIFANSIHYALSGKSKYEGPTHKSLWGPTFVKGRPRNVCAEFKCANIILQKGDTLDQYELIVFSLANGTLCNRCLNCINITKQCLCAS